MRLAKYLAHSGVASRRSAERLIASGRVRVGGTVVTDPARDVGDGTVSPVQVDGAEVTPEPPETWAVNKPVGVVSTAREPGSRRAVVELVESPSRLYPVGRLDLDSAGLILLTNDGELANRLTHPRYGVTKTYRVGLSRKPGEGELDALAGGVQLEDGPTAPARVTRLGPREIEIEIGEGRNRQIRRMAAAVGNEVESLTRVAIGSLQLVGLAPGESRRLGEDEIARLWKDAWGEPYRQ